MNREPQQDSTNGRPAGARRAGILVADDMAAILTLLKFELEAVGFNVWLAVDGDDALDLYSRHRREIDLVLLDVNMPGLDGPHTLEVLRRLSPNLVACFMSGDLGVYTAEELFDLGAAMIFSKPFRPREVADLLQRLSLEPVRPVRFISLS